MTYLPPPCPPARIALTPGEPAGIGPDLCVRLAQQAQPAELIALCDPELLSTRAARLGLPLRLLPFDPGAQPTAPAPGQLRVDPVARPQNLAGRRGNAAHESQPTRNRDRDRDQS